MSLRSLSKLLITVVLVLLLMVSLVHGFAEDGITVVVRRGADDSIYVDAYGNQSIASVIAQQLPVVVVNYSSSYQQPRIATQRIAILFIPRTLPGKEAYTQRMYSESINGTRLSYVVAEFRQGSNTLFTMMFNTSAKLFKENMTDVGSYTWSLLYNKSTAPSEQLDTLKQMVMALQYMSPEEANKQLAMAGLGWLKYRSLNVSWVEKGSMAGMLFNAVMETDYMGLAYTYSMNVTTLMRYLELMSLIETRSSMEIAMDGKGLRMIGEEMYRGENLEKLLRDIAVVNREVGGYASISQALPQLIMLSMLSPQQQATIGMANNFTEALQRLANITGLTLLPSNSSATILLNPSANILTVDVKNVRLWHVDGPSKAVAVVTAFVNTLRDLGINISVETEVEPDKAYEQQMRQSLSGLVRALTWLAKPPQITITTIATASPTTQTTLPRETTTTQTATAVVCMPPTTTVTVPITITTAIPTTVISIVTTTVPITLTYITTAPTTVMTTVTTTVTGYTTAIAIGVTLLVIGFIIGYIAKRS
ncbi:MAG: hypothetical protein JHC33_09445 [Ignisphaera sp.]|nr:hypothetical protein [Ignisphaera sp.]